MYSLPERLSQASKKHSQPQESASLAAVDAFPVVANALTRARVASI